MIINAVRGHGSELGITASQGASRVNDLIVMIEDPDDVRLPAFAREALGVLMSQLQAVKEAIRTLERKLQAWHRSQQASQRLTTIPGVGVTRLRLLWPRSVMAHSFNRVDTCRPGWVLSPGNIPRAAKAG